MNSNNNKITIDDSDFIINVGLNMINNPKYQDHKQQILLINEFVENIIYRQNIRDKNSIIINKDDIQNEINTLNNIFNKVRYISENLSMEDKNNEEDHIILIALIVKITKMIKRLENIQN